MRPRENPGDDGHRGVVYVWVFVFGGTCGTAVVMGIDGGVSRIWRERTMYYAFGHPPDDARGGVLALLRGLLWCHHA